MFLKKIANIVFYKYYNNEGKEERKACIFYSDGTADHVSYDEGIDACLEIVKERRITSKEAFKELINNDIIHVMSGKDLNDKFDTFIVKEPFKKEKSNTLNSNNKFKDGVLESIDEDSYENNNHSFDDSIEDSDLLDDDFDEDEFDDEDDFEEEFSNVEDSYEDEEFDSLDEDIEDDDFIDEDDFEEANFEDYNFEDNADDSIDEDIEDFEEEKEENQENQETSRGFLGMIKRGINKIKKNKIVRRISLVIGGIILLATGYVCGYKSKEGQIHNSNFTKEGTISSDDSNVNAVNLKTDVIVEGNNDFYDNYTFNQLQEVTTNKSQKKSMSNLYKTINNYNGKFADAFLEDGKNIRAGLKFEEIVTLQHAYNDYNKEDIKAYFNGAEVNATDMDKDYKAATLQLMGAHVIETRENPVDMSNILNSKEAKEFYAKYHEMFLAAKEATGEDKLEKVNLFRKAVREDFPISNEVRIEGIMHADAYDSIQSYKLSVVPMISASEIMFQNLETDYTLNDLEIDFLNDAGLCNYAEAKFERIETITLSASEDNANPLYEQYKNSIVKELKDKLHYVTDDVHRNLSDLDAFQKQVNWHFETNESGEYTGETYYTTETRTETNSWTTQQTNYREETNITKKAIPAGEKAKIDQLIAEENARAKAEGEAEAEETRQEMQEEADEEGEKIKEEISEEEKDLEDAIKDNNEKIDQNNKDQNAENDQKVNEKDFGDQSVTFDEEHKDDKGNLNDSVENITINGDGVQSSEELPDPNKTGANFDKNEPTTPAGALTPSPAPANNLEGQSVGDYQQQPIAEYEEEVDAYVEKLANSENSEEESYEYTK